MLQNVIDSNIIRINMNSNQRVSHQQAVHSILKRINSTGDFPSKSMAFEQPVPPDFIKDMYPGEEDHMNIDDDDLVQKSSIISYQESGQHDGRYSNPDHNKTQVFGKRKDKRHDDNGGTKTSMRNLREAIAELYLDIKQKTRDENDIPTPEEEQEEREIIMSLDSYVIIEYIKSSVDIILNLKFEEIEKRLIDKNQNPFSQKSIQSEQPQRKDDLDTERSHSQAGDCPKVYEELIQQLESDIRKHIRIEQQLKLHIESMENRIEELENDNEKLEKSVSDFKGQIKQLEESLNAKEDEIQSRESEVRNLKDAEGKAKKEVETLRMQLNEQKHVDPMQWINQAIDNVSRSTNPEVMNKTQPMIIKQPSITNQSQPSSTIQQIEKMSFQNQDSYSSNHSFAEGQSPERRNTTPDITHPYLHQTQIVPRKKIGPGTGSKNKKYLPNSVVESLGLQSQFNVINSTYSTGSSGKVIGQRKLSSQHSRNHNQTSKGLPVKSVTQNSWIGQMANGNFTTTVPTMPVPLPQFSNIINNNIQGLSINYSNQIIANGDQAFPHHFMVPVSSTVQQKLASNVTASGDLQTEDSESSNLNSHRRCKSHNVKRDRSENAKSIDRKKGLKQQDQHTDMLNQITESLYQEKLRKNIPLSNQTAMISKTDDTFESNKLATNSFIQNESTRFAQDFLMDHVKSRRISKNQASSVTQQTLTHNLDQSKTRTTSNRTQQQNQCIDDSKNRFNQSYGGGQNIISVGKSNKSGGLYSRNVNILFNGTNQSIEKSKSRNKKASQLLQSNTVGCDPHLYSGGCDLSYKTTSSTSQAKNLVGTGPQTGASTTLTTGVQGFNIVNRNNSATNTSAFLNQTNINFLKQQLMAQKKASNLMMKGNSPAKK